ncbi:MAG: DUF1669 domain-containing protein [Anaerolineae bacterium]|nr:DUF1669 domain-containing protein [Anaerolineae bacterium]
MHIVRQGILCILLVALLAGCEIVSPEPVTEEGTALEVAFSQSATGSTGLDLRLAQAIDSTTSTIDIAAYDLNISAVVDALVRAHQRGVTVRLVVEGDYQQRDGPTELQKVGAPVVIERRDPYMHNKFMVLDGRTVWTGSWNFAYNETYRNDNNVVIINSEAMAENYTAEFEEMFTQQLFGSASPANTPYPQVRIGDVELQVYFSPDDNPQPQIVETLKSAQSSIHFMAFNVTDNDITNVLLRKQREGLSVRGVMEADQSTSTGGDYESLLMSGIDVLLDGNEYRMHHKVFIVDESVVVTGSYNFTRSAAEYNDENVLIIHSPEIAALYLEEFSRVYQQAQEAQ